MITPSAVNTTQPGVHHVQPERKEEHRVVRDPEAMAVGLDQHIVRHSPTGIEWGSEAVDRRT